MEKTISPKVIFMMGLPGSGKSYLARHLSEATGFTHINSDKIRKVLGKGGQYRVEDKELIYREMEKQFAEALQKNENIIVDATFYRNYLRREFREIAEKYTQKIYWILMTADEETIKERVSKKRPDSEATFEIYQLIRDQFEPLHLEYLEIKTDDFPVEENLKQIIKYCKIKHDRISN